MILKRLILLAAIVSASSSASAETVDNLDGTWTYRTDKVVFDGSMTGPPTSDPQCVFDEFFEVDDPLLRLSAGLQNASDSYEPCKRAFIEWDLSEIPNNATVIDTKLEFEVFSITQNVVSLQCDFYPLSIRPSVSEEEEVGEAIDDINPYLSNQENCKVIGEHALTLGTAANLDVQAALKDNWYAIGIKSDEQRVERQSILPRTPGFTLKSGDAPSPHPSLAITFSVPEEEEDSDMDKNEGCNASHRGNSMLLLLTCLLVVGLSRRKCV